MFDAPFYFSLLPRKIEIEGTPSAIFVIKTAQYDSVVYFYEYR